MTPLWVSMLGGLADLDIARLGLGNLQRSHEMLGLHDLGQHGSGLHVLSDLQGQIDQHARNSGANVQMRPAASA